MSIWGQFDVPSGRLRNIRNGIKQFQDDVEVAEMPNFPGPYGYNSVTQMPTAAVMTLSEQMAILQLSWEEVAALCVLNSITRGLLVNAGTTLWAQQKVDAVANKVLAISPQPTTT